MPTEAPTEPSAEDANLVKLAIAEVERYRSMDRLIPSPHNVVTIAVLEVRTELDTLIPYLSSIHTQFYLVLTLASLVPSNPRIFFPLTR